MRLTEIFKSALCLVYIFSISAFAQAPYDPMTRNDAQTQPISEDFSKAWPTVDLFSNSQIKVMAIDERPYVVSGKKEKSYTGAIRSLYGIPFDVATVGLKPLHEDIENAIANGLNNAGVDASIAESSIRNVFKTNKPEEKLIVITLFEWVTDTYLKSTGFTYKITCDIYGQNGRILATATVSGTSKTFISPIDAGRYALTELLSHEAIASALSSSEKKLSSFAQEREVSPEKSIEPAPKNQPEKIRLQKLKELLDSGFITRAEYDKKKSQIIDAM